MADSGGYWSTLAEAQRLTQSTLVPGVIEEDIRRGGLMPRLPIMQAPGTKIEWNRENAVRTARKVSIGGQLVWTDNITYTPKEAELVHLYDQTPLNNFVQTQYGTMQNYRNITLRGMRKGMIHTLEDRIIYDDLTFGTDEFDGLHAIAEENTGDLDIDEGGALSLQNLRVLVDAMKYGVDALLMSFVVARRLDAFYQEGNTNSTNISLGSFAWGVNEIGMRVPFWNGIEIVRSDHMVAEEAGTGEGSDAKAKNTGTAEYTIFAIKYGQVAEQDPGLTLLFGGQEHELGEFFRLVVFPNLEDFDAEGLRLIGYTGLAAGSSMSVGRIHGITDAAVTA